MTWKRLKDLMDAKYYRKDAKRAKEQGFLSLKQGNMSAIEYPAKFNELRFTLTQVATEEMKMDHFAQGLKGSIKSMITGHSFNSYQDQ